MKGSVRISGIQPGNYFATVKELQLFVGKPYHSAPQIDENGDDILVPLIRIKFETDDKQTVYHLINYIIDKTSDTYTFGTAGKAASFLKAIDPTYGVNSVIEINPKDGETFKSPVDLLEAATLDDLSEEGFKPYQTAMSIGKLKVIGSRMLITIEAEGEKTKVTNVSGLPK